MLMECPLQRTEAAVNAQGFHGFHVFMGMTMLLIQLLRSVFGGQFTADDHFGFEASSWYWHFVDVVWVFLFLFVYVL